MIEWLILHKMMVIGTIWMIVIGPSVGNYACSVIYRLPRGKTPFERHPFCGHCGADLKPIDLAPILSWLSTRGRCRYCSGPIPSIYTVVELVCGAIFIGYFLHFGINEQFLLYAAYAVFVVIMGAIHWQQGWIAATIYSYAFACVAIARALSEHTIYPTIQGAFLMLLLMLGIGAFSKTRKQSPFTKSWIWWFVLMGALVPMHQWNLIAPIFILKMMVPGKVPLSMYKLDDAGEPFAIYPRVILYAVGALVLPLFLNY